jgi:hypothetical protein
MVFVVFVRRASFIAPSANTKRARLRVPIEENPRIVIPDTGETRISKGIFYCIRGYFYRHIHPMLTCSTTKPDKALLFWF